MPDARPTIAVSMGDPLGIGPEIIVKALADPALRAQARFLIFGLHEPLLAAADKARIDPYWWRVSADSIAAAVTGAHDAVVLDHPELQPPTGAPHAPSRESGEASFRFVDAAIAAVKRGLADEGEPALRAHALVTAPISKEAWALAGHARWPGHTELLAARFNARRAGMLFVSPALRVILATVHLPLMDVRNVLTIGRVFDAIDLGHNACRSLGVQRPRIAVCGLNPHAGEHGLLGDEESRLIEPAIRLAVEAGIDARGPFPGDTVFIAAARGDYDIVVAMYHDQGLIPVKLLGWEDAVNVTVGLPAPRTSPDHGTAFDIAGKNKASPRSMHAALALAAHMCRPHTP